MILFRAVLAVIVLANAFGLYNLVSNRSGLLEQFEALEPWMIYALALLSVASIVSCLAMWTWRSWGLAGLCAAYALMFAINLAFRAPLAHTALGPVGLVVLFAAWLPVRARFRSG